MARYPALTLVVVLAACEPEQPSLGPTLATYPTAGTSEVAVGPGGSVAYVEVGFVHVVSPDHAPWLGSSPGGERFVIARGADRVYGVRGTSTGATLVERAAPDARITWVHEIVGPQRTRAVLAADSDDVYWFVVTGSNVDFGGGTVGTSGVTTTKWGRYHPDGALVASGEVDTLVGLDVAVPRPGGGFVAQELNSLALVAFDGAGHTEWRLDREVLDVALHEDGELTILEAVSSGGESRTDVVRLDAARQERWRTPGTGRLALVALPEGSVLVQGTDSLAGALAQDAWFLEHVDADGQARRSISERPLELVRGAAFDGYAVQYLDSHDIVVRGAP